MTITLDDPAGDIDTRTEPINFTAEREIISISAEFNPSSGTGPRETIYDGTDDNHQNGTFAYPYRYSSRTGNDWEIIRDTGWPAEFQLAIKEAPTASTSAEIPVVGGFAAASSNYYDAGPNGGPNGLNAVGDWVTLGVLICPSAIPGGTELGAFFGARSTDYIGVYFKYDTAAPGIRAAHVGSGGEDVSAAWPITSGRVNKLHALVMSVQNVNGGGLSLWANGILVGTGNKVWPAFARNMANDMLVGFDRSPIGNAKPSIGFAGGWACRGQCTQDHVDAWIAKLKARASFCLPDPGLYSTDGVWGCAPDTAQVKVLRTCSTGLVNASGGQPPVCAASSPIITLTLKHSADFDF